MKEYNEKGLGLIQAIILLAIIILVIVGIVYFINNNIALEKKADIKANMLLIQGACKVKEQKAILDKNNDSLVGKKLSDVKDDEIIEEFKKLGVISESDYEKYYVLSDADLDKLSLNMKNESGSYYIINYETSELIITSGYEEKYKLSDITANKVENTEEQNDNKESSQEQTNENNTEDNQ